MSDYRNVDVSLKVFAEETAEGHRVRLDRIQTVAYIAHGIRAVQGNGGAVQIAILDKLLEIMGPTVLTRSGQPWLEVEFPFIRDGPSLTDFRQRWHEWKSVGE